MGDFTAHIFQDIRDRAYVLALTMGDVSSAEVIHSRIHSSCVTSETLRAVDCDCVQQLEGALHRIAERKRGILFYFMQEGRGVGYIAKSRDRMLVQASGDSISTFQAYHGMGLDKDYRDYSSISAICKMMNVKADFILMTNNPDKVSALTDQGLLVKDTETIEYEPSPYNLAYLASKAAAGHTLSKARAEVTVSAQPPKTPTPFSPYVLPEARRFIHVSTYYLPIKPIDDWILLEAGQRDAVFGNSSIADVLKDSPLYIRDVRELENGRWFVQVDKDNLRELRKKAPQSLLTRLLNCPYWFLVHVYYDLVSWEEFVVLEYGEPGARGKTPLVRLQSESLFNRFPLENVSNRDKYKHTLSKILDHGYGFIVLLSNDGRGAGFGAHASDRMMREAGVTEDSLESYEVLGVDYESRDYQSGVTLLKRHLASPQVKMVMNSPDSIVRKTEYALGLHREGLSVEEWVFLDT
jgi:3,4-dihydroxy 2-butanone 4-phosphate synthase/GTP cyclohydrolase II